MGKIVPSRAPEKVTGQRRKRCSCAVTVHLQNNRCDLPYILIEDVLAVCGLQKVKREIERTAACTRGELMNAAVPGTNFIFRSKVLNFDISKTKSLSPY